MLWPQILSDCLVTKHAEAKILQIKHHAGSGAFAHVYFAVAKQVSKAPQGGEQRVASTSKQVALKVFRSEFDGNATLLFLRLPEVFTTYN